MASFSDSGDPQPVVLSGYPSQHTLAADIAGTKSPGKRNGEWGIRNGVFIIRGLLLNYCRKISIGTLAN